MKKIIELFLLCFLISSCGDSPFLNDDEETQTGPDQIRTGTLGLNQLSLQFTTKWRQGPHIGRESQLFLLVTDKNDRPTDIEKDLHLKLWMPTMGHGSFPIKIQRVGVGLYEARDIFFTMPGLWDIHFQVKEGERILEEALWSLTL